MKVYRLALVEDTLDTDAIFRAHGLEPIEIQSLNVSIDSYGVALSVLIGEEPYYLKPGDGLAEYEWVDKPACVKTDSTYTDAFGKMADALIFEYANN